MRLLYLSAHSILEYDELRLFEDLGIEYFSLGSYIDPRSPVDPIRPALKQERLEEAYSRAPERTSIPKEFFDLFDVIVIMHCPEWVTSNWENMKHKMVIWRSIGQSTASIERSLLPYFKQGLKLVRYSPKERVIADYAGETALIRFYKDENEFTGWTGETDEAITFCQNMKHRGEFCNVESFENLAAGINAKVYGPKNENSGTLNGGFLSYDGMRQKMREAGVYIYTGTQPACYTLNFIEALMTGIPMVAIGEGLGNSLGGYGKTYEVAEILASNTCGVVSDDLLYLRWAIKEILEEKAIAREYSKRGREKAIELFGYEKIKREWKELLGL